jgi:hypothetical protein
MTFNGKAGWVAGFIDMAKPEATGGVRNGQSAGVSATKISFVCKGKCVIYCLFTAPADCADRMHQ